MYKGIKCVKIYYYTVLTIDRKLIRIILSIKGRDTFMTEVRTKYIEIYIYKCSYLYINYVFI